MIDFYRPVNHGGYVRGDYKEQAPLALSSKTRAAAQQTNVPDRVVILYADTLLR